MIRCGMPYLRCALFRNTKFVIRKFGVHYLQCILILGSWCALFGKYGVHYMVCII